MKVQGIADMGGGIQDMLMPDEVEWPGQEVEMLFGDSDSDTPLGELPAWLWRKQHQTQQAGEPRHQL